MPRTRDESRLESLFQLAETDAAVVVANPIWRRLRKSDPDFLTKTPALFRLRLLRHYYRTHRRNPWGPIAKDREGEIRWPMWKLPIMDYSSYIDHHPDDED